MAVSYTTLVAPKGTAGSIRNWVNYELLPVEDLIADAESLIYGMLRVREMRAMVELSLPANAASVALPARFLDPIALHDRLTGAKIIQKNLESFADYLPLDNLGAVITGTPCRYAVYDEALNFDAKPTATTALRFWFYRRPVDLGTGNLTNFLTDRYARLLRMTVIAMAHDFRQNSEAYQATMQQAMTLIQAANAESDLAWRGAYGDEN